MKFIIITIDSLTNTVYNPTERYEIPGPSLLDKCQY